MLKPKVTQELPGSPVHSALIPPSLHREGLRLYQHPSADLNAQSLGLDSGQKTMPGLLPRVFVDQWRELALFYFHKFHIENYCTRIQHNESFVCLVELKLIDV